MSTITPIKSALISVFYKDQLDVLAQALHKNNVTIYSTGGTQEFLEKMGIPVIPVEKITDYPSILGGRVKTLHPKVFGGILNRRDHLGDQEEMKTYDLPHIDLVVVDLYPFEKTVASGATEDEIIEKIDIGGISLIRATAKNFKDTTIIPSIDLYKPFLDFYQSQNGGLTIEQRKFFAKNAFDVSSHYDSAIFNYFNTDFDALKISVPESKVLRYGENPHQKGYFFGNFEAMFNQLNGKELSYNNLLDVDAAVNLMFEFKDDAPTFAILKHNNACGIATENTLSEAYIKALNTDPTSAFGGVLIANKNIDLETANAIHPLFCEVIIAPSFDDDAFALLVEKKNRILLIQKNWQLPEKQVRTALNGYLVQDRNSKTDVLSDLTYPTKCKPTEAQIEDLLFASKVCKNTKSNTIVLVKNKQMIASGTGQTSRIDALKQAIEKAKQFNFDLKDCVMASDAFFPFPDCVEIAFNEGIKSVIQPGGSIKDQLSIDFCDENNISMIFTGTRHFKH
jgi:phosphoribosylaminoimidazolecarboxamide formyltransferase/IMP cyclohydrolase